MENTILHNPYFGPYLCVDENATCNDIDNLQASNLLDSQITFSWDPIANNLYYDYRYKKNGDLTWTSGTINSTSITLQNLDPMSFYTFEVRSNCNDCYATFKFQTPCSDSSPCDACYPAMDKVVNTDQTLVETEISGNIIVQDGATLTIITDVQFAEESQLIIQPGSKVIVDGATLSKCPIASSWKGVHVQHALGTIVAPVSYIPGKIDLINGATIRDAEIGIDCRNSTTLFGNYTIDFGGGIVTMDHSYILNCTNGIQFAHNTIYGIPDDKSTITSSFIEDCYHGIYADGSIGVEIIDTRFIYNLIDLQSYESSFHLELNKFYDGISMESELPTILGSNVISNTFYEFDMIVSAQGNIETFNFNNNMMMDGSGIWIVGDLDFMAVKNDFLGSYYGIFSLESGDNQANNEVRDNYFLDNIYGNVAVGTNDIEYLSNCFDNSEEADIEVNNNSSIRLVQGDEVLRESAGNCFENSTRIITGTTSISFDYWTKDGYGSENISNCKNPGSESLYNFEKVEADFELPADDCGSDLVAPNNPTSSFAGCDCDPSKGEECEDEIADIKADIEALENDGSINFWIKRRELAKLKRCLDRLIKKYVQYLLDNGELEEAIAFLSNEIDLRYRAMAYALIIETLDYDRARAYISNLSTSSQEEMDFKAVQHINLDYLMDRENYSLSMDDKSELYTMGKRSNPTSGYARSLYYRLTGERIYVDYEHVNNAVSPKSRNATTKDEIDIFPNPVTQNFITISLNIIEPTADYTVSVHNIFGKHITTKRVNNGVSKVNVGEEKGILIVMVIKNEKVLSTKKVVKL